MRKSPKGIFVSKESPDGKNNSEGDKVGIKSIESLSGHKAFPGKDQILVINSKNNSLPKAGVSII